MLSHSETDTLAARIWERKAPWEVLQAHRDVCVDLKAGLRQAAPRGCYQEQRAGFAGICDYCNGRIRRGQTILYSSLMPSGHKVICAACAEARLNA